ARPTRTVRRGLPLFSKVIDTLRRAVVAGERRPTAPIVVHQMAKVGSMSVYLELQRHFDPELVFHTHVFEDLDEHERAVRAAMTDPTEALAEIEKCRSVRRRFEAWDGPPWKVVTLVRDPIARSLSLLFHSINSFIPQFADRYARGGVSLDELRAIYLTHYAGDPSVWFDRHVLAPFGVDVFAEPFRRDAGHHVYRGNGADVLLIRLEDLAACSRSAFRSFLGVRDFRPKWENVNHGPLYATLKRSLLDDQLVEMMYHTRVATHFYSRDELAGLKEHWLSQAPTTGR
ncbi:MAG TPA: putative capsular polysaccharide synthesis family protein, partial [Fimbriiglobus sp.]|nr:putative capsular polysaccharide synthesis family protein [Fimbriiglobus sp.]